MKRYDTTGVGGLDESANGDWVWYEDHLKDKEITLLRFDSYLMECVGMNDEQRQQAIEIISATLEGKDNE